MTFHYSFGNKYNLYPLFWIILENSYVPIFMEPNYLDVSFYEKYKKFLLPFYSEIITFFTVHVVKKTEYVLINTVKLHCCEF